MNIETDVLILGAGMVGAALACALLKNSDLSCIVVDAVQPDLDWPEDSHALRVSAINRSSQKFLESIDVWEPIAVKPHGNYDSMRVWDAKSDGAITMNASLVNEPELGFIVDNRVIQTILWQQLQNFKACQVLCPEKPMSLIPHEKGWELVLASGSRIVTKFIVGADGAQSWSRDALGIACKRESYNQVAIVGVIHTEKPHAYTAWQRFLPEGPLAFLPLAHPYHSSIVWTVKENEAANLCALSKEAFCEAVEAAFDHTLGKLELLSQRGHFPLHYHHAERYVKHGAALIGDAAHGIHPLAGQGVNLGFMDAKVLSEVIFENLKLKRPWHTEAALKRYERQRRGANALTLQAMNGLNALFSNESKTCSIIRGLGLSSIDKLSPVKRLFIRQAMGLL